MPDSGVTAPSKTATAANSEEVAEKSASKPVIPGMLDSQDSILMDMERHDMERHSVDPHSTMKSSHNAHISSENVAVWEAFEFLGWADEAGSPRGREGTSSKGRSPKGRFDAYSPSLLATSERQRNWNSNRQQNQRQSLTRGVQRHHAQQAQPRGRIARSHRGARDLSTKSTPRLHFASLEFRGDATPLRIRQQTQPKPSTVVLRAVSARATNDITAGSRVSSFSQTKSSQTESSCETAPNPQRVDRRRQLAFLKQRFKLHSLRGRRGSKDGKLKPMREKSWKDSGLTLSSLDVRNTKTSREVSNRKRQGRQQHVIEQHRRPIQQLEQNKLPHISRAALDEITWGVKDPYTSLDKQLDLTQMEPVLEPRPFTVTSTRSLVRRSPGQNYRLAHQLDTNNAWQASKMPNQRYAEEIRGVPARASSLIRISRLLQRGNIRTTAMKDLPNALPLPDSKNRKQMTRMRSIGSRLTERKKEKRDLKGLDNGEIRAVGTEISRSSVSDIGADSSIQSLGGQSSMLSGGASISSLSVHDCELPNASKPRFRFDPHQSVKRAQSPIPESFTKPNFFSRYEGTQSSGPRETLQRDRPMWPNKTGLLVIQGDQFLGC